MTSETTYSSELTEKEEEVPAEGTWEKPDLKIDMVDAHFVTDYCAYPYSFVVWGEPGSTAAINDIIDDMMAMDNKIKELDADVIELNNTITELRDAYSYESDEASRLQSCLEDAEHEIADLRNQLETALRESGG